MATINAAAAEIFRKFMDSPYRMGNVRDMKRLRIGVASLIAVLGLAAPAVSDASTLRSRALARLAKLHVAKPLPIRGYDRDLFPTWLDPDGNGCNARQDALIKYGTDVR